MVTAFKHVREARSNLEKTPDAHAHQPEAKQALDVIKEAPTRTEAEAGIDAFAAEPAHDQHHRVAVCDRAAAPTRDEGGRLTQIFRRLHCLERVRDLIRADSCSGGEHQVHLTRVEACAEQGANVVRRKGIDRGKKRAIYAREAVSHVWLINPAAETLEVLALESGRWTLMATHVGAVTVRAEPFEAVDLDLSVLWSPGQAGPSSP